MVRYLGIDYGLERTGLAISGPDSDLVFPLPALGLKKLGTRKKLLDEIGRIGTEYAIDSIVLGLPLHGDGSESEMSAIVRNAAERIRHRLNVQAYLMPEYLSSMEARQDLRAVGLKGEKLKKALDSQAACCILASFLAQPPDSRMRL